MIEFKQLGVGLAAAVLIDAVVVRIVVLPALMALLGRANWWPGRLTDRGDPPSIDDIAAAISTDRPAGSRTAASRC
jgi:RND superfamily putative drug exporter